jgi:hypothetical protein
MVGLLDPMRFRVRFGAAGGVVLPSLRFAMRLGYAT